MITITIKQPLKQKKSEFETIQYAIDHLTVLWSKKNNRNSVSLDPQGITQTSRNKAAYEDRKESDYISFNQLKKKYGIPDKNP